MPNTDTRRNNIRELLVNELTLANGDVQFSWVMVRRIEAGELTLRHLHSHKAHHLAAKLAPLK